MFAYLELGIVLFVLLAGFGLGVMFGWSLRAGIFKGDGGGAKLYNLSYFAKSDRGGASFEAAALGREALGEKPLRRSASLR